MPLVRMTFQHPILFTEIEDADGKMTKAVAAGHPTRPARDYEQNVWHEERDDAPESVEGGAE